MRLCHRCGKEWISDKKSPGVKETCPACDAWLHCCKNCRHHVPSRHNQCFIPNTDWVGDRAGANFCDEFEFAGRNAAGNDASAPKEVRGALDALFGGGDEPEERGRGALDKLFGD
jgi:hypothetical protein